jgi:hypothetical protein
MGFVWISGKKTAIIFPCATSTDRVFSLRKKLVKSYTWSIALCGAETWTLRKVDQKYVESFEILYWKKVEIIWGERRRKYSIESRRRRKISYIEGKIEGGIEVTGRRRRRRKHLLDDLKEMRGYWTLKEEALDRTV